MENLSSMLLRHTSLRLHEVHGNPRQSILLSNEIDSKKIQSISRYLVSLNQKEIVLDVDLIKSPSHGKVQKESEQKVLIEKTSNHFEFHLIFLILRVVT